MFIRLFRKTIRWVRRLAAPKTVPLIDRVPETANQLLITDQPDPAPNQDDMNDNAQYPPADRQLPPEMLYLSDLIRYRLITYLDPEKFLDEPSLPPFDRWELPMAAFVQQKNLDKEEITILLLALAPHVYPDLLDHVIDGTLRKTGDFPRLGGARGKNFRGFLPTGETAIFILHAANSMQRARAAAFFGAEHYFARQNMLWLEEVAEGEPVMSGRLILSQEYVDLFTTGKVSRPHFSSGFPARYIETHLDWSDLVLNEEAMQQIRELETWVLHNDKLMRDWNMQQRLKPGYRILFYGPPGTGKTFTATLLGKYTGREVYKIDLSMVVSKYIGETEKNLEKLFAKAEAKKWILFFDEADAIFGKRTNVRDAHDKYANQEVSYLLQRIEEFDGLVILASNMKGNIDESFIRRFNAMVRFSLPDENERLLIWRKSFPSGIAFNKQEDIPDIVKRVELTGGSINNVVQYACLKAIEKNDTAICLDDVLNGIRRELHKEGKPFTGVV